MYNYDRAETGWNIMGLYLKKFTGFQNGKGWKGPLEVTWSDLPAQAGTSTVVCTGPCPDIFCRTVFILRQLNHMTIGVGERNQLWNKTEITPIRQ